MPRSRPHIEVSCAIRISSFAPPVTSARASEQNRFHAAAAELPAQRRNDAERARMIAAFGDLQVGGRARRRDQTRQKIVLGLRFQIKPDRPAAGLDVFEQLDDAGVRSGPDDAVDLRNQALQLGAVALRETAGDDQLLPARLRDACSRIVFGRFFLRRIDERAGVDDDGVGAARPRTRAASRRRRVWRSSPRCRRDSSRSPG